MKKNSSYKRAVFCLIYRNSLIRIKNQKLGFFQSVVVTNITIQDVEKGVLVERFSSYTDEEMLFEEVKKIWPLAYDIRKEERLKGVSHYLSPKANLE